MTIARALKSRSKSTTGACLSPTRWDGLPCLVCFLLPATRSRVPARWWEAVAYSKKVAEAMHEYMQSLPLDPPDEYANVPVAKLEDGN